MVRSWVYDPRETHYSPRDESLTKSDIIATVLALVLTAVAVVYMLYITASFDCPECSSAEKMGRVAGYVANVFGL